MSSALYGRDAQARAVLALLDGARAGRSGAALPVAPDRRLPPVQGVPKLDVSARSQLAALTAGQGLGGRGSAVRATPAPR